MDSPRTLPVQSRNGQDSEDVAPRCLPGSPSTDRFARGRTRAAVSRASTGDQSTTRRISPMRQCAPARTLTSAALALLTVALAAGPAGATTSISACGSLTAFGETYNVTTDLTSCGVCLLVLNDRITINLQGHSITASCASETLLPDGVAGGGIDDSDGPRDAVTVKNGTIVGYEIGINLAATSRAQV